MSEIHNDATNPSIGQSPYVPKVLTNEQGIPVYPNSYAPNAGVQQPSAAPGQAAPNPASAGNVQPNPAPAGNVQPNPAPAGNVQPNPAPHYVPYQNTRPVYPVNSYQIPVYAQPQPKDSGWMLFLKVAAWVIFGLMVLWGIGLAAIYADTYYANPLYALLMFCIPAFMGIVIVGVVMVFLKLVHHSENIEQNTRDILEQLRKK